MAHEVMKHIKYPIKDDRIRQYASILNNISYSKIRQYLPVGFAPRRTHMSSPHLIIDIPHPNIKSHILFSVLPDRPLEDSSLLYSITQTIKNDRVIAHISLVNNEQSGGHLNSVLTLRNTTAHPLQDGISHATIYSHEDFATNERMSEIHIGLPLICASNLVNLGIYSETEKDQIDLLILCTKSDKPHYYISSKNGGPTCSLTMEDIYRLKIPLPYFFFDGAKTVLIIGDSTLVIDLDSLSDDYISHFTKSSLILNISAMNNGVDLLNHKKDI